MTRSCGRWVHGRVVGGWAAEAGPLGFRLVELPRGRARGSRCGADGAFARCARNTACGVLVAPVPRLVLLATGLLQRVAGPLAALWPPARRARARRAGGRSIPDTTAGRQPRCVTACGGAHVGASGVVLRGRRPGRREARVDTSTHTPIARTRPPRSRLSTQCSSGATSARAGAVRSSSSSGRCAVSVRIEVWPPPARSSLREHGQRGCDWYRPRGACPRTPPASSRARPLVVDGGGSWRGRSAAHVIVDMLATRRELGP
jgi:hypothetical protein